KKSLSPGCREILLEKMKEIENFNASRVSGKARDHGEGSTNTQKEKRARYYICKIRGHVFWKCPNKKRKAMSRKQKEIMKPTFKKVVKKVKYPKKVHVITNYMIEGIDDGNWNETWYVSSAYKIHMCLTRSLFKRLKYKFEMIGKEETKKKFIFSYGIRDVTMEAREGNFLIPNVHYTPEVTLNILRESSTKDDGLKNVVTEHNKYLDEYFESIEPKEEVSLVKGLEELKWDRDDVQDYMDEEYISWNGTLYALKVNSFSRIDEIPPVVGVMEINLLSLHKIVDNLGGYLCVTLGDNWKTVAGSQGLTDDDREAIKECYRKFINMVQVYYEIAKKPWYERNPKEDVVENSSGNARLKDPEGKEKDDAGKKEALEEDMNKETQFGVRLEDNVEEEVEGSITDSNDFEVIV
nr:ARID DNA-binding domain-containing protein [Tanacetum cinerariifolium]